MEETIERGGVPLTIPPSLDKHRLDARMVSNIQNNKSKNTNNKQQNKKYRQIKKERCGKWQVMGYLGCDLKSVGKDFNSTEFLGVS